MLGDIISVAQQLELDPTDIETGTWITVERKKTGPLPFNVEYSLRQLKCKSEPLNDAERELLVELKSMEELFPRETYAQQAERLEKHLNGSTEEEEQSDSAKEAVNELS